MKGRDEGSWNLMCIPLNVQGCFSLGKVMKGCGACVYH